MGEIVSLAKLRRRANASKERDDRDFLAFCEAVGGLAGLQQRGRDARAYAEELESDEAVQAALIFLRSALPG
jgi:hypothetical protein